jgi:hypothetical protein
MAREKATITLDRSKAAEVRALLGVGSTSEAIDQALDQVILGARLRADVDAYRRMPPTGAEAALGSFSDPAALEDDTDWSALYPEEER